MPLLLAKMALASSNSLLKEVGKPKYKPIQIVRKMQEEGYRRFTILGGIPNFGSRSGRRTPPMGLACCMRASLAAAEPVDTGTAPGDRLRGNKRRLARLAAGPPPRANGAVLCLFLGHRQVV